MGGGGGTGESDPASPGGGGAGAGADRAAGGRDGGSRGIDPCVRRPCGAFPMGNFPPSLRFATARVEEAEGPGSLAAAVGETPEVSGLALLMWGG